MKTSTHPHLLFSRSLVIVATQLCVILACAAFGSFLFPGLVSAQVLTHGPVVGGVTNAEAKVFVRSDQAATVVVRYGTDPTLKRGRLSNSIQTNAESDFTAIVPLAGLAAEKTYYLNVLVNGVRQLDEPYPYFTTFAPPGKAREFKFVVLTDFHGFDYSIEPVQTYASAAALQPAFCFIGGDFDHSGPLTLTEKRDMFKSLYDPNTPYSWDFVPMILRRMAIAHQWDDHDSGPNNLDKNYPDWNLTQQVFEEYVPTYPLPSVTPGIWQQFSYAQADFFILDCRSQRDVWDDPEGPDKSMLDGNNLGADGQLEWLESGLLTSTAKWKVIFTSVITNTTTKLNDAWGAYQTEWNALKNFILANNILNVVFISGDLHLAAIDNGVTSGFPEMCVAAANQTRNRSCPTAKHGTWSEGYYDETCAGFGLVSILQNPDRLVLEAADEFGIIHLSYTVPDQMASRPTQGAIPVFTDVTVAAGLAASGTPFGNPSWGDFDGDGYLDLWVDNHYNSGPYSYKNNGNGTFTDVFDSTGLDARGDKHGNGLCDYNNDGNLDLHITIGAGGGHLLGEKSDRTNKNLGGFFFLDVTKEAGTDDTWGRGRSVAWGDYDRDGYADLLLGNLKTDLVLYRNNGDETFTNVAVAAGLGSLQYNEACFADYDNDGYPDIYLTDVAERGVNTDRLFRNNGDGTFSDVTAEAGIQPLTQGRSLAWGDYNNDGYLDLFISRGPEVPSKQTLYQNNGDGTFADVTDAAGLGVLSNNRAAGWGDFDNDGYLDLYVVSSGNDSDGKGPNYLYRNNRNGTFREVAERAGVQAVALTRGRGASWGDYDNDGFLDLFTNNGEDNTGLPPEGPQFLFHNQGNSYHWIEIRLVGTVSNRDGLGATVKITVGRQTQYRENNGSMGHYLSQQSTPLHFGLGKSTLVKSVVISWPSGISQTLRNVAADQKLVVTEGQ